MPTRIARTLGLAILPILIALAPMGSAADSTVIRNGSRLSLSFHDTELKVVLQQLQRDAKITVTIPPTLMNRSVTVKVQNMEIDLALETLFKSAALRNFAIVHEPGVQGRIKVVMLEEGKGHSVPSSQASTKEPAVEQPVVEATPPTTAPVQNAPVQDASDPMSGVRWTGKAPDSDPNAPPPQTIPQLPQFAAEQASGESGPQEMAVPASAVPPAMANLPPEPGPQHPGGPEGAPFTPQMRAAMGFPPASGH
jgi:hypothetical protein